MGYRRFLMLSNLPPRGVVLPGVVSHAPLERQLLNWHLEAPTCICLCACLTRRAADKSSSHRLWAGTSGEGRGAARAQQARSTGGICRPGQQVAVSFKAQRGPKPMGGNDRKVFLIITTAQSGMHSMNIISVSVLGTFQEEAGTPWRLKHLMGVPLGAIYCIYLCFLFPRGSSPFLFLNFYFSLPSSLPPSSPTSLFLLSFPMW